MRFLSVFFIVFLSAVSSVYAAAPAATDFGELPTIYDAAISPDAKRVALFLNVKGAYGIVVVDLNDTEKKPPIAMLGDSIKPQWIKWANNDRVLASVWQSDKYRTIPYTAGAIYTLAAKTLKGKYLVKPPRGLFRQFNNQVIDFLEDDPEHILMSYSNDDVESPDIMKVEVESGSDKRVKKGNRSIQTWVTDRRGEPRVGQGLSEYSTREERWKLIIRDAHGDKWRDADEYQGLDKDTDIFGFTGNVNELIVGLRKGRDTLGLYIYDLQQKSVTRTLFHDDEYDVSDVVLSSDGHEVIGAKFVSETSETKIFDGHDTILERMRVRYQGYTVDYVDQSQDETTVLFKVSSGSDAGALMLVHSANETPKRISGIRTRLNAADMGMVIPIRYTARDGSKVPAYVTLPPKVKTAAEIKQLPFIVLPHGGPYARKSNRFDYFAQFFATRGYGVLQMNFRGSAGYGEAYEEAGRKNWVLMQEDVEDGTRWLIDKGYADPNRLCIAGWSYGGYAALMGTIKDPDLYKCAVSIAGVTDLKDLINDSRKYAFGKLSAYKSIIQGFEDNDAIKENSPRRRADEIRVPVFMAHGKFDQRVHYDQYTRMVDALKKSPAKVTAISFKEEDHYMSSQENRQEMLIKLDKFLKDNLGKSEFAK